jgi:WD40 repeat protein
MLHGNIAGNIPGSMLCIAFAPDGKILASGDINGPAATVCLWDVEEQKQVALWDTDGVQAVAFSPDGKWLAAGGEVGVVLLWEVNLPAPSPGKSVEPADKQLVTWGKVRKTELLQNFPNPFNPETWIPFTLSEPKHVIIRIYNPTGQLVRALDLGQKPPGLYLSREKAAYWDGRNEAGETVASDVYFYAMEAGGSIGLKKMVLAH